MGSGALEVGGQERAKRGLYGPTCGTRRWSRLSRGLIEKFEPPIMDDFLKRTAQAGDLTRTNQAFTVSGRKARESFLASVPPDELTLCKALFFLADAMSSLGAPPDRALDHHGVPQVTWIRRTSKAPKAFLERGKDWIKERYQHPFASQNPLDLAWDRAWLRLISAGRSLEIGLRTFRKKEDWSVTLCPKGGLIEGRPMSLLDTPLTSLGSDLYFLIPNLEMPPNYARIKRLENRLRAGRGRELQLGSTHCLWSECGTSSLDGNWYDYRCKHLCLYERFVLSEDQAKGLNCKVILDPKSDLHKDSPPGLLERHGRPGFFRSFLPSGGLRVMTRRWLPSEKARPAGQVHAKAVFSLALDDRVASVDFFTEGHSLETVEFPQAPKGLIGIVHWPQLKSDLWGQRFVRDEAWEQAQAWTREQIAEIWRDLGRERHFLLAEICVKHTKPAYYKEVRRKLEENWFGGIHDGLHRGTHLLPTVEEKAEAIRRRLGF